MERSIHTQVVRAAASRIRSLLSSNPEAVNARERSGKTPLHKAVKSRRQDVAEVLLEAGAEVDATYGNGRTALHDAAGKNLVGIAEALIGTGADLNASENGWSPLHEAAWHGSEDVARLLVHRGATILATGSHGETTLHCAAWSGHRGIAALLIAKGINVNATECSGRVSVFRTTRERPCEGDGCGGASSLHWAAYRGTSVVTKLLVDNGADVNARDEQGATPLHVALIWGSATVIESLAHTGSDVNSKAHRRSHRQQRPMHRHHKRTVDILIANGANVSGEDCKGRTPLHYAVLGCEMDIVRKLLEEGADVNTMDNEPQSPLGIASSHGRNAEVKLLLARGASGAFMYDGYDVEPEVGRGRPGGTSWRVPVLGHSYTRRRDAIRAINNRLPFYPRHAALALERGYCGLDQQRTVIGRDRACDVCIPDRGISPRHCEITRRGKSVMLRDLGSATGTYHNGVPIKTASLIEGDEITVGTITYRFVLEDWCPF